MSDVFRTFIVPAPHADLARALCALDAGGAGMFRTPLSATGEEPATHYVSTGQVPPTLGASSPCAVWECDTSDGVWGIWKEVSYEPGRPDAVHAAAAAAGLECTLADVEALFFHADVTAQDPFTAFGRLGLHIVVPAAFAEGSE